MQPATECLAGAALAEACRKVVWLPAARAGAVSEVAVISATANDLTWAICFSPYMREADNAWLLGGSG